MRIFSEAICCTRSAGGAQNYNTRTACVGRPPRRERPPRASSSMKTETPMTSEPRALGQLGRRLRGAAGRQDVVDDEHTLALAEGVGVHLEAVLAVLETVVHALGAARQLPRLARGHDADVQLPRQSAAEEKAARLDSEDLLRPLFAEGCGHRVDGCGEGLGRGQQRRDVPEQNALRRKIGDVADEGAQIGHRVISKDRKLLAEASSSTTASTREPRGPWRRRSK